MTPSIQQVNKLTLKGSTLKRGDITVLFLDERCLNNTFLGWAGGFVNNACVRPETNAQLHGVVVVGVDIFILCNTLWSLVGCLTSVCYPWAAVLSPSLRKNMYFAKSFSMRCDIRRFLSVPGRNYPIKQSKQASWEPRQNQRRFFICSMWTLSYT